MNIPLDIHIKKIVAAPSSGRILQLRKNHCAIDNLANAFTCIYTLTLLVHAAWYVRTCMCISYMSPIAVIAAAGRLASADLDTLSRLTKSGAQEIVRNVKK